MSRSMQADLLLINSVSVLESRMKLTFHARFWRDVKVACSIKLTGRLEAFPETLFSPLLRKGVTDPAYAASK